MAIQNRRGNIIDLDPHKMIPGEFGISVDNKEARICFEPGTIKTIATKEDFQVQLDNITEKTERAEAAALAAESLIINKAGINDVEPTLTEAYSGAKTQGSIDTIKTDIWDKKTIYDDILPFKQKNFQIKGQMHCHTTTSDGKYTPAELLALYKNAGYGFVAITDHDGLNVTADVADIIHIRSSEYYAWVSHAHLCAYNTTKPRPDLEDTMMNVQNTIDFVKRNKGLTSFAHPQMGSLRVTDDEAYSTQNYNMMEIYTAFDGACYDNFIDNLLKQGKRFNVLAVDDFHDEAVTTFNGGWIIVNTDKKDADSILEEIEKGNYYSSNGNDISLSLANGVLTATSSVSSNFNFITDKERISNTNTTSASYSINGDELYIRVESQTVADNKWAWSNPIFINKKDTSLVPIDTVKPTFNGTGLLETRAWTGYQREELVFVSTKTDATCSYVDGEFTISSGAVAGSAGLLFSSYQKDYAGRTVVFSFDVYRTNGYGMIDASLYYSSGDKADIGVSTERVSKVISNLHAPLKTYYNNLDNYVHYEIPVTLPNNICSIMTQVRTFGDNTEFKVKNFKFLTFGKNVSSKLQSQIDEINKKYTIGTWTPSLKDVSGNELSHIAQFGKYERFYNKVTATFSISINNLNLASGQVKLTGLPFMEDTGYVYTGVFHITTADTSVEFIEGVIAGGDMMLRIKKDGVVVSPVFASDIPVDLGISGTIIYYTV